MAANQDISKQIVLPLLNNVNEQITKQVVYTVEDYPYQDISKQVIYPLLNDPNIQIGKQVVYAILAQKPHIQASTSIRIGTVKGTFVS
jgi:hypothetical protein